MSGFDRVVFSIPVWGRFYAERFLAYTLPCILSNQLFQKENSLEIEFHFFTDQDSLDRLNQSERFETLVSRFKHSVYDVNALFPSHSGEKYNLLAKTADYSMRQCVPDRDILLAHTSDYLCVNGAFDAVLSQLLEYDKEAVFIAGIRISNERFDHYVAQHPHFNPENLDEETFTEIVKECVHESVLQLSSDSHNFTAKWPAYLYWVGPQNQVLQRGIHLAPVAFKVREGLSYGDKPSDSSTIINRYKRSEVALLNDAYKHGFISLTLDDELPLNTGEYLFNVVDIAYWMLKHAHPLQVELLREPIRYYRPDPEDLQMCELEAKSDRQIGDILSVYELFKTRPALCMDFELSHAFSSQSVELYGQGWLQQMPELVNKHLETLDRKLVLVGVSRQSSYLWRMTNLSDYVVAVTDLDEERLIDAEKYGLPVIAPSEIGDWADAVYVSVDQGEAGYKRQLIETFESLDVNACYDAF